MFTELIAILKSVYVEATVADEAVWHKRMKAPLGVRTVSGETVRDGLGQIWRRKYRGEWQYQQDPETDEEFADRNSW